MDRELARRSHALLKEALNIEDQSERRRYVDQECAENEQLRRKMASLLRAVDRPSGFLETSALPRPVAALPATAGAVINGYRVERIIGVGGMATVYEAIQESTRRRVALKVLRHGLTRPDALQRFRFETEILAKLRHPAIAQIYDAGAYDDGRGVQVPYFAMEHVPDALPITEFATARGLELTERLALFVEVCDAVQHGHLNGVIHRDLKPSNVLVDASGRPKVIDFGIARSTDPDQTVSMNLTDERALIGTLNYMSPEQCAGSVVDARADVYSLGVMLYELVTGRLPHDLSSAPLGEALRKVREDAPVRPGALDLRLRGDIEAIILMALEKEPDRRYRTAAALATDIRRHLRLETIEARPPTLMRQCRLFARRNRTVVNSAIGIAAALLIGLTMTSIFAWRATHEAKQRRFAEEVALADRDAALWQAYVANIAAAMSGHQSGEIEIARRRLDQAPVVHRDWEWRLLASFVDRTIFAVEAHDDMIFGMDMSADGSRFVTAGRDGIVRVWDADARTLIAKSEGAGEPHMTVAFNPDTSRLATGSEGGLVQVWDAMTGDLVRTLHDFGATLATVSYGDDVVAAATINGAARLLDASTGETIYTFDDQPGGVTGALFSPDRAALVTWNQAGDIRLREYDGAPTGLELSFPGDVYAGAFSADGALFAAGGVTGIAVVWDLRTGAEVRRLQRPGTVGTVRSLAFSPDNSILAAGQSHREIMLWPLNEESEGLLRRGHGDAVSGVRFTRDGRTLISTSWDRTVRAWDMDAGAMPELVTCLRGYAGRIINARFSPDGSVVATASDDGAVRLWDPVLVSELGALRGHAAPVYGLAFSNHGDRIATGSHDHRVRVFSAHTGSLERELDGHGGAVWTVAFSPDNQLIASAGDDRTIRIWDPTTGAHLRTFEGHSARVISIAFSPDGETLASSSRDHTVRVWNVQTGALVHELAGHTSDVFAVIYSGDGRTIYTGSRDQSVRVWNAADGALLHELKGHGQFVTSLSLTPDQRRLAAGSWFGEIMLWDLERHEVVASFKGHENAIRAVAFDGAGERLVTGSHDGTVRVFEATPEPARIAKREAARAQFREAEAIVVDLIATHGSIVEAAMAVESLDEAQRPWARKALLRHALSETPNSL